MPLLSLLRILGVFTALADILAGYLLVRFTTNNAGDPRALVFLLLASACLYMAGMAWNDVFDAEEDRTSRPERPIPSGQISLTVAFFIAVILLLTGLLCAMAAGMNSFLVASALIAAILFYNAGGKGIEILGPVSMGSCRSLNLLLGMTAHSIFTELLGNPGLYLPILLIGGYTCFITLLASQESTPEKTATHPALDTLRSVLRILCGVGLTLVPLTALYLLPRTPLAIALLLLLAFILALHTISIIRNTKPMAVRKTVGFAIAAMVILNAGFIAAAASANPVAVPIFGWVFHIPCPTRIEFAGILLVALLFIPAHLLRRRVAVT